MPQSTLITPTPDLACSVDWWARAGMVPIASHRDGVRVLGAGKLVVEVDPDHKARTALALYGGKAMDASRKVPTHELADGRVVTQSPAGVRVVFSPHAGPGVGDAEAPLFGAFVGLSMETLFVEDERRFWTALGYKVNGGSLEYGYVELVHDLWMPVSALSALACPHLFPNPGLTFFNGANNVAILRRATEAGFTPLQSVDWLGESGIVDNAIYQDPGGLGLFVYSDG